MARTFNGAPSKPIKHAIKAVLASLMLYGGAQASQHSLCQPGETVWFSCRVSPAKTVSLCGTRETLQYRFGSARHLELQYPALPSSGYTAFQWAHYSRSQVDRTEVSFHHQGSGYTLFDHTEGIRRETGVALDSGRRLRCLGAPQSQLGQLKDKLPCDEDSALNLGACPPGAE